MQPLMWPIVAPRFTDPDQALRFPPPDQIAADLLVKDVFQSVSCDRLVMRNGRQHRDIERTQTQTLRTDVGRDPDHRGIGSPRAEDRAARSAIRSSRKNRPTRPAPPPLSNRHAGSVTQLQTARPQSDAATRATANSAGGR